MKLPRSVVTTCSNLVPAFCLTLVLLSVTGCTEEPQIRTARVPTAKTATEGGDVMLAAIVPTKGQAWFFKLTGSKSEVDPIAEQFESLLATLSIGDGKPVWKAPAEWKEVDISGTRAASFGQVAAFDIPTDGEPLKCTVSQLGAEDPTQDEYVLVNLNRWRGQLGQRSISIEELKSSLEKGDDLKRFELADGTSVTFARIDGQSSTGGGAPFMGGGPFAGGGAPVNPHAQNPVVGPSGPPTAEPRPSTGKPVTEIAEMSFTPGSDWNAGKMNQFRAASWQVDDGADSVEIYITKLPASGLADNVNRWRGQAGLPALEGAELDKTIEKIDLNGTDCHVVILNGEKQSVFGAIIFRNEIGWFIKLQGSPALATKQEAAFRDFVKSIKFK